MVDRPIYIDIDGTLTDSPDSSWGMVFHARIAYINKLVILGTQVVIWSGCGTEYAKAFCEKHGLKGIICVGKPEHIVDDNPDIRPRNRMLTSTPEEFFKDC